MWLKWRDDIAHSGKDNEDAARLAAEEIHARGLTIDMLGAQCGVQPYRSFANSAGLVKVLTGMPETCCNGSTGHMPSNKLVQR